MPAKTKRGGEGKTKTAVNLAACLATAEQPTLLVDCDSQANATAAIGFAKDPSRRTLYHLRFLNDPVEGLVEDQRVIEGSAGGIFGESDSCSRIGLGIAVNERSRLFSGSKTGGEIHSRGCFAHSAFLICDRDDSSQVITCQRKSSKGNSRMQDVSRGTL